MADLRIPPGSQALTPVQPAGRDAAVKAAQRAFFNAALQQTAAPAGVRRQTQEPARPVAAALRTTIDASSSAQPDRILRPGSLLDIKV